MGKKKGAGGHGKNSIMNGRALFTFNPTLFKDEEEEAEKSAAPVENGNGPVPGKFEEEKQGDDGEDDGQIVEKKTAEPDVDEGLFAGENAEEEDVDFD